MICSNCKKENQEEAKFCAQCGTSFFADQQNSQVSTTIVPASNTGMFYGLKDLSLKRTAKQAVGFYIAYVVLIMIIAGLLSAAAGIFQNKIDSSEDMVTLAIFVGGSVSTMATFILADLMLTKKRLLKQPFYGILALFAGVLTYFMGTILGLIVVAYLSTLEPKNYEMP